MGLIVGEQIIFVQSRDPSKESFDLPIFNFGMRHLLSDTESVEVV
jgi:hypothetical protein